MANALLVFNRNPYDGTDVTWNGLRLAEQLLDTGLEVKIFLMNDSVDLALDAAKPPEGYFDLGKMLEELIGKRGHPLRDSLYVRKFEQSR